MLEVKFYDTVDDVLLKFAVIIPRVMESGYSVNIKNVIHMKFQEDIAKKEKIF